jgi:hypothetical protein
MLEVGTWTRKHILEQMWKFFAYQNMQKLPSILMVHRLGLFNQDVNVEYTQVQHSRMSCSSETNNAGHLGRWWRWSNVDPSRREAKQTWSSSVPQPASGNSRTPGGSPLDFWAFEPGMWRGCILRTLNGMRALLIVYWSKSILSWACRTSRWGILGTGRRNGCRLGPLPLIL